MWWGGGSVSDDTRCDKKYVVCPPKSATEMVGSGYFYNHTITSERTVSLGLGTASIVLQKRHRDFAFSIQKESRDSGCVNLLLDNGAGKVRCGCAGSSHDDPAFSEKYDTFDVEMMYLDLRNDVVVIKEITNSIDTSDLQNTAKTTTVDVFTGYESQAVYPFVYEAGIPIVESIKYKMYVGTTETELHSEDVGRGYPFLYLLMPTYPKSNFGDAVIVTQWATEIEWYRQDRRDKYGDGQDGDAYLFWPEWGQSCGKLSQALDAANRDLIYNLSYAEGLKLEGSEGPPELALNKKFQGSIAFDVEHNMFYSIAVPDSEYAVTPGEVLNQKLTRGGAEVPIPNKEGSDRWFPIAPL